MSSHSDITDISCPICFETMKSPILLCVNGHSLCGRCVGSSNILNCPKCRGPLTKTRNYQLEGVIEGIEKCMKMPCYFKAAGCTYLLSLTEKESHELECRYRKYYCEGRKYAKWDCDWTGRYGDLEKHFQEKHLNNISMKFRTEASIKINLDSDYSDIQLIPCFQNHLFYYKHRVNVTLQKIYFCFQFIGTKSGAKNFYYEFEVNDGSVRKLKVTEFCENDITNVEEIYEKEKCVVMSFKQVKSMLNKNEELSFKFRIMSLRTPKISK